MPVAKPLCPECEDHPELEYKPPLALACPRRGCNYRWDH